MRTKKDFSVEPTYTKIVAFPLPNVHRNLIFLPKKLHCQIKQQLETALCGKPY